MTAAPLIALLLAACSGGSGPATSPVAAPPAPDKPDIILVTLDTTRSDRLGAYGYDKAGTDWIDAKAAAGMRFERAYSVQPLTIPAHSSIMTGLWPWRTGVRSNGDAVLSEGLDTLAERLKAGGWQTGASVAAFVTSRNWGFSQGFDTYDDHIETTSHDTWHQSRPASQVVDDALSIVSAAKQDQPLFLWVHLYDAHFPYAPPEEYAATYGDRPYDGEIAYMDDQLERLEAGLKAAGRTDPLWVMIGDHGESLGEHRELTHGLFVYDSTQHVPWIISGHGVKPAVISQPVSQVDLVPTVLSLAGRPVPTDIDGKVQPGNPHPAWMESYQLTEQFGYAPHTGVVDGDMKLIRKPKPELYDVAQDEHEKDDLAAEGAGAEGAAGTTAGAATDRAAEIARLSAVMDSMSPVMPTGRTEALDPEALARLQALGYVTTTSFDVDFANLPDPEDHKDVIGKVLRAEMMSMKNDNDGALALMREALAEQPDVAGLYSRFGRMLAAAGKPEEARKVLEQAVKRFPEDEDLLLRAASLIGRQGDDKRSLALAQMALVASPDSDRAAEYVTGALINLKRQPEALTFTGTWLQAHPEAANIAALRGILLFDGGDPRAAEPLLRLAAKEPNPRAGVCQRLAAMALAANVVKDAERWIDIEIEKHGESPRSLRIRLTVLRRKGENEAALALADKLLVDSPNDPELLDARAVSLFDLGRVDEAKAEVEAALVKVPEQPDLLMLLANIQLKQGNREEAEKTRARAAAANARRVQAMKAGMPRGAPPPQSPAPTKTAPPKTAPKTGG